MAEPLTWQVLQAIAGRLALVTVANGFRTNAGLRVHVEQVQADPAKAPVERFGVSLDRASREVNDLMGNVDWTLEINVQADIPSTIANAQARAHAVMSDVLDVFPAAGLDLAITAGFANVSARSAEFLTRLDGSNSSIAQVRLQALVRLPA